jgi:hypothetical protein
MTLDELETICWREGLTRPQVDTILVAAGSYATTQAIAALAALGQQPTGFCGCLAPLWPGVKHTHGEPPPVHLLDLTKPGTMNACEQPGVNTTQRDRVSCDRCTATPAWKGTPSHET